MPQIFFCVLNKESEGESKGRALVCTPFGTSCLPGTTRNLLIDLIKSEEKFKQAKVSVKEKQLSISEFYYADEVFTTGSMGEITPVVSIDGRIIGSNRVGPVTQLLQTVFRAVVEAKRFSVKIPQV
jgi:branched-subunit amino acid aminotransferase/4-amino-4-deoxychorismate lyase